MSELMTRDEMLSRLEAGEDPGHLVLDKWRRIRQCVAAGKVPDGLTGSTCAWCERHRRIGPNGYECGRCPIAAVTGKSNCSGTPYKQDDE